MRGTLRKCRTAASATAPAGRGVCKPVTKAAPPAWLADDARKIFDRTARMLISWKVLTKLDIPLLAAYAAAYANLQRAYADIVSGPGYFIETENRSGSTSITMHPAAKLFGLSPVSRRQVESADAKELHDAEKATDPFGEFLDRP